MRMLKSILGCVAGGLLLIPVCTEAGPLTIVNVSEHAADCVFNPTCTVAATAFASAFTIPGVSGTAQLHSPTYLGATGAPAAGKTGYAYRVDLTQAKSTALGNVTCVSKLILDFGPDTKLVYGPATVTHPPFPADVFVITSGGPGSIGLASAVQSGNFITFTFTTPICPGIPTAAAYIPGKSSFLFGLAAATAPEPSSAQLVFNTGGTTTTSTRVPIH